jgi:hypothetical protein
MFLYLIEEVNQFISQWAIVKWKVQLHKSIRLALKFTTILMYTRSVRQFNSKAASRATTTAYRVFFWYFLKSELYWWPQQYNKSTKNISQWDIVNDQMFEQFTSTKLRNSTLYSMKYEPLWLHIWNFIT